MFVGPPHSSAAQSGPENGNWVKKAPRRDRSGTVKTTANGTYNSILHLRLLRCLAVPSTPEACVAPAERTNKHNDGYSMQRGTIKWFDTEKGFGFIEPEEGGEDVFLHVSNITGSTGGDDLREGQTVAFETERTEKGLSALNASPVG